jgi:hypothetical protein
MQQLVAMGTKGKAKIRSVALHTLAKKNKQKIVAKRRINSY